MLELLIVLVVSAGVLGIIIAVMEEGDFPGWISMSICVVATMVPTAVISLLVPLPFLGAVVGAICGGFAISATCGMTVKRASIAAGIFLAFQIGLGLLMSLLFSEG